jgi:hypothetical protein
MLSTLIDAHERRDVATADIAGAYLKAPMDDYVIMKFTGDTGKNPVRDESSAQEVCESWRGGTKVLYVRLVKAIYGCVKSAFLWYHLFSGTLVEDWVSFSTRTILALQTVTLMANNVP